MKQIKIPVIVLLVIFLFLSCDISSPYIDAIFVKMDEDLVAESSVATVSSFSASATSYDSASGGPGIISLNWVAPVVSGNQTAADSIVIRYGEGTDPADIDSGIELYDSSAAITNFDLNTVDLGISYHFGIWTKDAEDNVSTGQFDSASIQMTTLLAVVDGYSDSYNFTTNFNGTVLYAGDPTWSPLKTYIQFGPVTAYDLIVQADLELYLTEQGSVVNFEVDRVEESWNSTFLYNELDDLSIFSLGSFTKGSNNSYSRWNVTSTVQYWLNSSNYGFRIWDNQEDTRSGFSSSESGNQPQLKIYYGSD